MGIKKRLLDPEAKNKHLPPTALASQTLRRKFFQTSILGICILFYTFTLEAESPILSLTRERDKRNTNTCAKKQPPKKAEQQPPPSYLLMEPGSAGQCKTDITFLAWQLQEDGLEFAGCNVPTDNSLPPNGSLISASLYSFDFSWDPAFKFLIGGRFFPSQWDLSARWTWFHAHEHESVRQSLSPQGAGIFPLWSFPQALIAEHPVYEKASAALILQLNNIDLELAYTGGVSSRFFVKAHGGLKAISIRQDFRVKYTTGASSGPAQMIDSNAQLLSKCKGIGPRIGFGTKWRLPAGFSLAAEAAAAFDLSQIRTKQKDTSIGTLSGNPQTASIQFKESFWVWRPIAEGKAGFQWECFFDAAETKTFRIDLSYEIQEYWDQNMFNRYADKALFLAGYSSRGNLTLHGASFTLAFGY